MPLQGNLDSFQPSDLLQFLIHSQKTGTLRVHDDQDSKSLLFRDGQIVLATHQRKVPRLEELVRRDLLHTPDGAHGYLEQKRRWDEVVGRALERQRALSHELSAEECAQGNLSKAEARKKFRQLKTLAQHVAPTIRLGEYLVVTGRVTLRQFEKALQEQIVSNQRIGEILVEQGAIGEEDIVRAVQEINALRNDFGPLYSLKQYVINTHGLTPREFGVAFSQSRLSGNFLCDTFVENGHMTADEATRVVREVIVEELCDLFLWTEASFEFQETGIFDQGGATSAVPKVHDGTFDLQSLLLRAHSEIDELRQNGLQKFSLETVFTPTEGAAEAVSGSRRTILRILDGESSLGDIRRVLPGNRFSHYRIFAEFLESGLVRLLDRVEAYDAAQKAVAEERHDGALVLLRHALAMPGTQPSNTQLRGAVQEARAHVKKGSLPGRGASSNRSFVRSRLAVKTRVALEHTLFRTGLARPFWNVYMRLPASLRRMPGDFFASSFAIPATLSMVVLAVAMFWLGGRAARPLPALAEVHPPSVAAATLQSDGVAVPTDLQGDATTVQTEDTESPVVKGREVSVRGVVDVYRTSAPVEAFPTVSGERAYVVSRDGRLHALNVVVPGGASHVDEARLEPAWELEAGEFGDILSTPMIAAHTIFLTNLRGRLFAISPQGRTLWTKEFSRLEPVPPQPIFDAASELVALAVVSRGTLVVVSTEDGEVLFEMNTGNQILAPPVVSGETLFVGSADNHIYCTDWRRDEFLWEYEDSDDIVALRLMGRSLVYATRSGRVGALNAGDGRRLWKNDAARASATRFHGVGGDRVFVATVDGGVEALAVDTGELDLEFQPGEPLKRLCLHGDRVFGVLGDGHLGELDALTGDLLWRSGQPVGELAGWAGEETFLVANSREGEVFVFPLADHDEKEPADE